MDGRKKGCCGGGEGRLEDGGRKGEMEREEERLNV